jgi:hypothetical protein
MQASGISDETIAQFANSDAGSQYTAQQLANLQAAKLYGNGQWIGPDGQNYSSIQAALSNWQATVSGSNTSQQNYANAANNQPGRDQTIFTGQQVNPNQSIFAGNASIGKAF